ncbi:hypothetical protein NBRGN_062_01450 [Nocardia brasiliensis NBRC 14402]|nr:hypothetical protein NBRGN_062_01450 [Nocardia brasiliensis NBRC 14402]
MRRKHMIDVCPALGADHHAAALAGIAPTGTWRSRGQVEAQDLGGREAGGWRIFVWWCRVPAEKLGDQLRWRLRGVWVEYSVSARKTRKDNDIEWNSDG